MIQEDKLGQAVSILKELDIDAWQTVGRETSMNNDPVIPLIAGMDFTATVGLIVTKTGEIIAVVGHNDAEGAKQRGIFGQIVSYDTSFESALGPVLDKLSPSRIALNYSDSDPAADGLSHGLFVQLDAFFKNRHFPGQIVSAAAIVWRLRGRKTPREIELIENAIEITQRIYAEAAGFIRSGTSEKGIFDFFQNAARSHGVVPSWQPSQCPGVMVGPRSVPGHNGPTDIVAEKGFVMDIDFGVMADGYCSDLQRIYYVLDDGETEACSEVREAYQTLQEAIRRAAAFIRPGVSGIEVDAVARDYVTSRGYPAWNYALGHQVGTFAHDGGTILAPRWERYRPELVESPVEAGNVFTLEPGIATSCGYVGQEDMVLVTASGGRLLSTPQEEIFLVR